jgi:hypothetical protein
MTRSALKLTTESARKAMQVLKALQESVLRIMQDLVLRLMQTLEHKHMPTLVFRVTQILGLKHMPTLVLNPTDKQVAIVVFAMEVQHVLLMQMLDLELLQPGQALG